MLRQIGWKAWFYAHFILWLQLRYGFILDNQRLSRSSHRAMWIKTWGFSWDTEARSLESNSHMSFLWSMHLILFLCYHIICYFLLVFAEGAKGEWQTKLSHVTFACGWDSATQETNSAYINCNSNLCFLSTSMAILFVFKPTMTWEQKLPGTHLIRRSYESL